MKKYIMLALAMLLLALGGISSTGRLEVQAASAATENDSDANGVTDNGFRYTTLTNGKAIIVGYEGATVDLKIPSVIAIKSSGSTSSGSSATTQYTVTAIAANAFAGKGGFSNVTIPEGIETIGSRAFYGCMSLKTVTIPKSVTLIDSMAFADCVNLTSFTVTDGNNKYASIDNCLYSFTLGTDGLYGYTLVQFPIGSGVTTYQQPDVASMHGRLIGIGEGAFLADTMLKEVILPDTVTNIGAYAFQGCISLTDFTMSEGLTTMGIRAFSGCSSLKEITMPYTLKSIPAYAFENCESLEKIVIPTNVTTIGTGAFNGCPLLTIFSHANSAGDKHATSNKISTASTHTVSFYNKGVLISKQEVEEGKSATPPSLAQKEGYQLVWEGSYTNVTADTVVTATWKRVYKVTFRDGYNNREEVVEVLEGANAKAPDWTMSNYTLKWETSFENITRNTVVNAYWVNKNNGFVVDSSTPKPLETGKTFTFANRKYKVTNGDPSSPKVRFTGYTNSNATTITIPDAVTYNSVRYSVVSIGKGALKGNEKVKTVTIGSNVTAIYADAFSGCSNLRTVKISSTKITTIGSGAFKGISSKAVIKVPGSRLTKYKRLLNSSGVGKGITISKL